MQQHAVPQNVTSFEFKIVGILTLKQFAMLAVCSVLAFIVFLVVPNIIVKVGLIVFFVGTGLLLTFGSIQQIPFYRWIFIFIKAIFSPTQMIWIKTAQVPAYMTNVSAVIAAPEKRIIEDRSVLTSYLQTLPTHINNTIDVLEQQKLQSIGMAQGQSTQVYNMPKSVSPAQSPAKPQAPQFNQASSNMSQQQTDQQQKLKPTEEKPNRVASEKTFNLPPITSQAPKNPAAPTPPNLPSVPTPPAVPKPTQPAQTTQPAPPSQSPVAAPAPSIPQTSTVPKITPAVIIQEKETPVYAAPTFMQNMPHQIPTFKPQNVAPTPQPPVQNVQPPTPKPIPVSPVAQQPMQPKPVTQSPMPPKVAPQSQPTPMQPIPQIPKPPIALNIEPSKPQPVPQVAKQPEPQIVSTPKPAQVSPTNQPQASAPQQQQSQPTPAVATNTTQSSPKFWSTMQKMEREYMQELHQIKDQEEKDKDEMRKKLEEEFKLKQEQAIKQKEQEILAQKQIEILKLQDQIAKQKVDLAQKEAETKAKEDQALKEIQERLDAEKTRREEFEKNNEQINQKLQQIQKEKAQAEEKLKVQLASNLTGDDKLKEQVTTLNSQLTSLNKEIETRITEEKQRQQKETDKIRLEYEAQKKLLENQKVEIEKQKNQIEENYKQIMKKNEEQLNELKLKNEELTKEKKRLEEVNASLSQSQKDALEKAAQAKTTPVKVEAPKISTPPIEPIAKDAIRLNTMSSIPTNSAVSTSKPVVPKPPKPIDDLDKLAADLQKQTEKLEPTQIQKDSFIHTETVIKPQEAPKPAAPKPKLEKEKTSEAHVTSDIEVANIPPITTLINVINGVVYDAAGNFVPNVIIIVKDTEKTPVRALKSNRLGQFAISTPLPNGIYTMEFEDSKEEKTFDVYQITLSGSVIPPVAVREKK